MVTVGVTLAKPISTQPAGQQTNSPDHSMLKITEHFIRGGITVTHKALVEAEDRKALGVKNLGEGSIPSLLSPKMSSPPPQNFWATKPFFTFWPECQLDMQFYPKTKMWL